MCSVSLIVGFVVGRLLHSNNPPLITETLSQHKLLGWHCCTLVGVATPHCDSTSRNGHSSGSGQDLAASRTGCGKAAMPNNVLLISPPRLGFLCGRPFWDDEFRRLGCLISSRSSCIAFIKWIIHSVLIFCPFGSVACPSGTQLFQLKDSQTQSPGCLYTTVSNHT